MGLGADITDVPADFLSLTPRFIDNVRYGLAIRLAISVRHTRAVEGECG